MPAVVFYFHLHQPFRIRDYSIFDIDEDKTSSFIEVDSAKNEAILKKVAQKCYFPANQVMLDLLHNFPEFKASFSITGTLIEQLIAYEPGVIDQFKRMAETGRVEFVDETYYHSLAGLFSEKEFFRQVSLHRQLIYELFGVKPTSFRNTELIYNDHIASLVDQMGYQVILAEGVERYLGWRSPNFVYQPPGMQHGMKLLLKNYQLSDDIAFRFGNRDWPGYPVTAEKYAHWVSDLNGNAQVVNLFMDYETIGEHQWEDTGIFNFFRYLPHEILKNPDNTFMTVTEAATSFPVMDTVSMPDVTSWADLERDVTAWLGNPMQVEAANALYQLEEDILASHDEHLIRFWRYLTTSDHFYYMCTKWFSDGDVHKYFSPNNSPYEAYLNFTNILHQLRLKLYAKNESSDSTVYQLITGISAHDYRDT